MGRKRQTGSEPQGQRNNSVKFPGFSFWPHNSNFILNRLATQKHKEVQIKQNPNKSLLSLAKRGSLPRQKMFTLSLFYSRQTPQKRTVATCTPAQQRRSLDLHFLEVITKHPTPQSGCQRRPRRKLGLSSSPDATTLSPTPRCQHRPCMEPEFPSLAIIRSPSQVSTEAKWETWASTST